MGRRYLERASVGAPHIRQRLYFVGELAASGLRTRMRCGVHAGKMRRTLSQARYCTAERGGNAGSVAESGRCTSGRSAGRGTNRLGVDTRFGQRMVTLASGVRQRNWLEAADTRGATPRTGTRGPGQLQRNGSRWCAANTMGHDSDWKCGMVAADGSHGRRQRLTAGQTVPEWNAHAGRGRGGRTVRT